MPMTFDGNGTITGLSAGGLPNGTVQPSDLSTGAPTWDTSGNVGVGTSSPTILGSGFTSVTANGTNGAGFTFKINDTASGYLYQGAAAMYIHNVQNTPTLFYTNNTERARIDASGNLLVNTTSNPGSGRIGVNFASASHDGIAIKETSGTTGGYMIRFVNSAGSVIGSITNNASSVTYNTTSDYRLKSDITPMVGALEKVAALKPCTYTWKSDGSQGEGFIAHELAEVAPCAVTGEKDAVFEDGSIKPQSIDTSFLVATLTAAIQELKAEVDALRAQVEANNVPQA